MITKIPAEPDRSIEPDKAVEIEPESQPNSKGSKDFSPEERAAIIAKAKEVGTVKVANEFGIKAQLITYWRHQEKKKAAKQSKPLKGTTARGKASKLDRKKEDVSTVRTVPTEPIKAIELVIADKSTVCKTERTVSGKVAEKSEEKQTQRDEQSLIVENAILKERIALLNAEIEKLRAALMSLM